MAKVIMDENKIEKIKKVMESISNPLFADRANMKEAWDYVLQIAKSSGNAPALWTAVFVLTNTLAKTVNKIMEEE